jgi:hypothetical protein
MNNMLRAIVDDDRQTVKALLKADGGLATRLIRTPKFYDSKIFQWIYAGDTALHLAAAGIASKLFDFCMRLAPILTR